LKFDSKYRSLKVDFSVLNGSKNELKHISSLLSSVEEVASSPVRLDGFKISFDLTLVEESHLSDLLGALCFDPGFEGRYIVTDGLASGELTGNKCGKSLNLGNSASEIFVLNILKSFHEISFEGLTSVVAGLDFRKFVAFDEFVEESSNEETNRLRLREVSPNVIVVVLGVNGSSNNLKGISSSLSSIKEFTSSEVVLYSGNISLNLSFMEKEVFGNCLLVNGLGPGSNSSDIGCDGLASRKLSGESSSNGLKLGDSSSEVFVFSILNGSSDVSLKGLASIVASFNFSEIVFLNESIHKSSEEKRDRLRARKTELGMLLVEVNSHFDVAKSVSLGLLVFSVVEGITLVVNISLLEARFEEFILQEIRRVHATFSTHVVDFVDGVVLLFSFFGASGLAAHRLVLSDVVLKSHDLFNDDHLSSSGSNKSSRSECFEHMVL